MRWYSPRDYVEEEVVDETGNTVVKGELSARMKIPGNMWVEAWETARVTPARRQRRLFDDTKEAEKVIFLLTWDLRHLQLTSKITGLTKFIVCCLAHMDLSVIPTIKLKKESIKYLAESNVSLYRLNRCN